MATATSASATLPRWSLAAVCVAHAALFGWAAAVLPWRTGTPFAIATSLLAVLHLATGLSAATRSAWLVRSWQLLSWTSLAYLAWLLWDLLSSAIYLGHVYDKLGQGLGAALMAVWGLFAVLTVPVAVWGFVRVGVWKPRRWQKPTAILSAGLVIGASYDVWANIQTRGEADPAAVEATLSQALAGLELGTGDSASLFPAETVRCTRAFREVERDGGSSLFVTFVANDVEQDSAKRVEHLCLQGTPEAIATQLRETLAVGVRSPIKLDWLASHQPLRPSRAFFGELIDGLVIRPGLDGVCARERCLMPWQLVARSWFAAEAPLAFAEKLRIGFSLTAARHALGLDDSLRPIAGLARISTHSFVVAERKLHALRRLKRTDVEINREAIARGESLALDHVLAAQQHDGSFRYHLDMLSGESQTENPSIPRHAGTTLALCELGPNASAGAEQRVRDAVQQALRKLASFERRTGRLSALTFRDGSRHADIGSSALGLIALLACRPLAGKKHDALRARLGHTLIGLLDEDGHFNPGLDLARGRVVHGPTPQFAAGQAIFALTLLEGLVSELSTKRAKRFPDRDVLQRVVERAMNYYSEEYWPRPLRDFFFLRENWHCLAARAALTLHRHDGYERFCLDYVGFKSRFILDEDSEVDRDLQGAMSFSNVFVPHNGSTAGLGEALAAAVAIRRARNESVEQELRQLRLLVGFLLRQQYTDVTCFACEDRDAARGGFSGETVVPLGRIDHTQHVWSAIGHGGEQLFPEEDPRVSLRTSAD